MLFKSLYGVDLGTDTLKLRDKDSQHFLDSKNMIAVRNNSRVIAIGNDAWEMYEKNPVDVEVSCPMSGGVIASATNMERVLSYTLRQFTTFAKKSSGLCLAVPTNVTPVQQRAFFNVISDSRETNRVRLIDKGLADAVSIGLDVLSGSGHMIVNIGGHFRRQGHPRPDAPPWRPETRRGDCHDDPPEI